MRSEVLRSRARDELLTIRLVAAKAIAMDLHINDYLRQAPQWWTAMTMMLSAIAGIPRNNTTTYTPKLASRLMRYPLAGGRWYCDVCRPGGYECEQCGTLPAQCALHLRGWGDERANHEERHEARNPSANEREPWARVVEQAPRLPSVVQPPVSPSHSLPGAHEDYISLETLDDEIPVTWPTLEPTSSLDDTTDDIATLTAKLEVPDERPRKGNRRKRKAARRQADTLGWELLGPGTSTGHLFDTDNPEDDTAEHDDTSSDEDEEDKMQGHVNQFFATLGCPPPGPSTSDPNSTIRTHQVTGTRPDHVDYMAIALPEEGGPSLPPSPSGPMHELDHGPRPKWPTGPTPRTGEVSMGWLMRLWRGNMTMSPTDEPPVSPLPSPPPPANVAAAARQCPADGCPWLSTHEKPADRQRMLAAHINAEHAHGVISVNWILANELHMCEYCHQVSTRDTGYHQAKLCEGVGAPRIAGPYPARSTAAANKRRD